VSGWRVLKVTAATIGKKTSEPSQTISDKESSVRRRVFIKAAYSAQANSEE
jgi:hypothetical protein